VHLEIQLLERPGNQICKLYLFHFDTMNRVGVSGRITEVDNKNLCLSVLHQSHSGTLFIAQPKDIAYESSATGRC
jgi:hypothetical protein